MELFCISISTIDILSILVGVLAVLTTVLLGWQLYSAITFDKRIEKAKDEVKNELTLVIKKDVDKSKHEAIGTAMYNIAESMVDLKQYNHAITCYIKALWNLYKENPDSVEVDICFEKIDMILSEMKMDKKILFLPDEARKGYLSELDKVNDRRKDGIVSYLINLPSMMNQD